MTSLRLRMVMIVIFAINLIHPFIHGTILDGGALDSMIEGMDVWAMTMMGNVR